MVAPYQSIGWAAPSPRKFAFEERREFRGDRPDRVLRRADEWHRNDRHLLRSQVEGEGFAAAVGAEEEQARNVHRDLIILIKFHQFF
jgi:hypothetical protein